MGIAFTYSISPQPGPGPTIGESKDGRTIAYRTPEGAERMVPTGAQWRAFERAVDRAGAWTWQREYENAGVLDGSMWELRLRDGERRMGAEGVNAEPAGFDAVVRALRRLIGGRPLE